ncbi:MAG: murein DD-endopeptidase MepM/ murein hydrolase activator NlpD [Bacteriovoracaceae bacterium]|jgi:murein DD-endopeptidase MepM/ murein hydrolase activator NlpD
MKKTNKQTAQLFLCLVLLTSLVSCETEQQKISRIKIEKQKLEDFRQNQFAHDKTLLVVKSGKVKRGEGLFQALRTVSVEGQNALDLINLLRDNVEFSKLKVGDELSAISNSQGELIKFTFSNSPAEKHLLTKNLENNSWDYNFIEEDTIWQTRLITGELKAGSTLQHDLVSEGLKRSVVGRIVNILLCKVHFRMDARMGDNYKVLLKERLYKGEVLESKILFTSYKGVRAGESKAYFYEDGEEKSTYTAHYTEDGEALIRSGLRYPVKRLHIRSGYGRRRHPVTGRTTMHRGVDLRGRRGSPVYAVASGVVIESKMTPIGGNKIAIRHNDRSVSYYLHLHKRHVRVGTRVKSHQVIGQVGATGRVTGPHLHFGFKKPNGRWMNPMHKRMIATPKLTGDKLASLKEQVNQTKIHLKNVELKRVSQSRLPAENNNI